MFVPVIGYAVAGFGGAALALVGMLVPSTTLALAATRGAASAARAAACAPSWRHGADHDRPAAEHRRPAGVAPRAAAGGLVLGLATVVLMLPLRSTRCG